MDGFKDKQKKSLLLCCFCFDKKSAIFVISALAIFHSAVNITLATKVVTEDSPHHVYVIAISVKAYDAPSHVQNIFTQLALAKIAVFITHLLASISLILALRCGKRYLLISAPVFVITEILALIYTVVECLFTVFQLDDSTSQGLVLIAMFISVAFMAWCTIIVVTYARQSYVTEQRKNWTVLNKTCLIAYSKSVEVETTELTTDEV
ncbi:uncharacterized protein [Clytia hemisphaerica]|uniref:Uncharacterized protein n=1 Tax=Clytia hemisphaerica TaxID=252671 RepID=A0A7M5UY60_9CNID|eukprot:TCONS_00053095-protein